MYNIFILRLLSYAERQDYLFTEKRTIILHGLRYVLSRIIYLSKTRPRDSHSVIPDQNGVARIFILEYVVGNSNEYKW